MSDLYNNFEKRFTSTWFSVGWIEAEEKPLMEKTCKKNIDVLQEELRKIEEHIETIAQKQLRLSNLASFYES